MFPVVVPILCKVLAVNFIAYGETKPRRIAGKPNMVKVEKNVAVEEVGIISIKNSIKDCEIKGINKINNPVENRIEHSFSVLGFKSDILPPKK